MKLFTCALLAGLFIFLSGCSIQVQDTHPLAAVKLTIQKHRAKENLVFETSHWLIELKEEQTYLGGCTLRIKRPVGSFSALTEEEWGELHLVMQSLEYAAKKAFGAKMTNWYGLMNYAYRVKPYMPLVHVHFYPRYEKPVSFAGLVFEDKFFGDPIPFGNDDPIADKETRRAIIEAIQDNLLGVPQ